MAHFGAIATKDLQRLQMFTTGPFSPGSPQDPLSKWWGSVTEKAVPGAAAPVPMADPNLIQQAQAKKYAQAASTSGRASTLLTQQAGGASAATDRLGP